MKPHRPTVLAPIALGFLVPLAATTFLGCKKDEPPPPLPSAAPAATPTPTAALELAPEPTPVESAAPEPKKTGTGGGGASLAKCCSALLQNAKSAPPPNNTYMQAAGQLCQSMVSQNAASAQIIAAVRGALGGAAAPLACQ